MFTPTIKFYFTVNLSEDFFKVPFPLKGAFSADEQNVTECDPKTKSLLLLNEIPAFLKIAINYHQEGTHKGRQA